MFEESGFFIPQNQVGYGSFGTKLWDVTRAIAGGVTARPEVGIDYLELEAQNYYPPASQMCALIEEEIKDTYPKGIPRGQLHSVPWSRHVLSEGRLLQTVVAFSDQHFVYPRRELIPGVLSRKLVDEIFERSEAEKAVDLSNQFQIAMALSRRYVPASLVLLRSATRAIARNSETRCDPERLSFSEKEIMDWKRIIPGFKEAERYDSAGDTYHFWEASVAGLLSEKVVKRQDILLNPLYRLVYRQKSRATRFLRYGLTDKTGFCHPEANEIGFKFGQKLSTFFESRG